MVDMNQATEIMNDVHKMEEEYQKTEIINESDTEMDMKKSEEKQLSPEESYLNGIKEKFSYYILLALGFGLLFTLCFYDYYCNFNGVIYPIFVIGLYVFAGFALHGINKTIRKNSYICIAGSLLFSCSSFITMNWFVVFFNTIAIMILFTIFLCRQFYADGEWGLFQYLISMMSVWLRAVVNIRFPFIHGATYIRPKNIPAKKIKSILFGVFFAVLFLSIVLPLLASADMVFDQMIRRVFSPEWNLFSGSWIRYLLFTVVSALLFYGMVCSFSHDHEWKVMPSKKKEATSVIVMNGIIAAVYLLFCGIQVIYLFGKRFFELPEEITYAGYAREGFFQLLFVAVINTVMVLVCIKKVEENQILKGILSIISACTFIMIASAAYRMVLYVSVYHLTFLRVLVLWFLAVLMIAMAGISYAIFHSKFHAERFLIYTILSSYLVFSFLRPDYLIASYNISHMDQIEEEDLDYLLSLSADATPAICNITAGQLGYDGEDALHSSGKYQKLMRYYADITELGEVGLRTFQISRYHASQIAEVWLREN